MLYLSLEEYQTGGRHKKIDVDSFLILEEDARNLIDYYTFNRIANDLEDNQETESPEMFVTPLSEDEPESDGEGPEDPVLEEEPEEPEKAANVSPKVKRCMMRLIDFLYDQSASTDEYRRAITSQSNHGVSQSFKVLSQEELSFRTEEIIHRNLAEEKNKEGVPLLYRGVK